MVFGALGAIGGALIGANSAKSSQANQEKFEKWKMANAHQQEVEDLKKAGLNPIMSAGGTGAVAGSIGSSAYDPSANIQSALTYKIEKQKIENETKVANADANKKNVESGLLTPKAEAEIREKNSVAALNSAKKVESKANTKYTNERARGFSESYAGSLKGGNKLLNGEASGSHSRTY